MRTLHILLLVPLLALLVPVGTAAAVEFFPLEKLEVGMKGVGKTVVRGTKVENFDVEIIDIMPNGGFDGGPMVLAKFSGPIIEASKGIAEGYSGSPVYIRGKLLGAVSAAIPYSDAYVGGITPIENMLTALPRRHRADYTGNTVVPEPKIDRKLHFLQSLDEAQRGNLEQQDGETVIAVPLTAPLMVRGLSPRNLDMLKEKVETYPFIHLVPDTSLGASSPQAGLLYDPLAEGPLKGGDAVTVSLICGDIDVSVLGTVTYVDEANQVLLFGHPFTMGGDIDMPLQKAYVTYTYQSILRPFKIGYSLFPVGAARQDRAAAVGGLIHETADTLPIRIAIHDIDYGSTDEFNVSIVRDEDWLDLLTTMAFGEAFVRSADTGKGGTMRLEFSLKGAGLKEPLTRVNYYYESSYPSGVVWEELLPLMSLLTNNIYREVKLTEVEVHLDFTRNRVNAALDKVELLLPGEEPKPALESEKTDDEATTEEPAGDDAKPEDVKEQEGEEDAEEAADSGFSIQEDEASPAEVPPVVPPPVPGRPEPKTVHAGDALRVSVRLQPYREDAIEQTIFFTLPEDFPPGPTSLMVHSGGGLLSIYNEFGGRGRTILGAGSFLDVPVHLHDLDRIVERALSTPLNNEIVITILKPGVEPDSPEPPPGEDEDWEPDFHVSLPTKWVIYGTQMVPIIVAPTEDETKENGTDTEKNASEYPDAVG
ncbi:MAG: hypothetical protein A2Y63_00650 [Candidatus Riflebacteria bacterium RBG_13_59_9]|nr:MAG: hypothetical protein A2Y63_00650 [Candidatus Riflebacteria bacterium RBG_13_59_9]